MSVLPRLASRAGREAEAVARLLRVVVAAAEERATACMRKGTALLHQLLLYP